jgi:rod shape-determining protein MreC
MRDYLDNRPLKLRGESSPFASLRPFMVALILGLLAVVLMFLDRSNMLAPARGTVEQAFTPIVQTFTRLQYAVEDLWGGSHEVETLQAENALLRDQVRELQSNLVTHQQLLIENRRLRQQLAIEEKHPWRLLEAEIIVRSPDASRRVMTIARGEKDGIQAGMAVVGQTDTTPAALVGIVESVGPHTASVLLVTDFASRISGRVLSEGVSGLGLVTGQWQYGSWLRLEQLDRSVNLKPGMVVVSAGLTGNLDLPLPLASVPAGIPIGTVEQVSHDEGYTLGADVIPFVDPDQVRDVWVVLSHTD